MDIEEGGSGDGLDVKSCPTLVTPWTVACKASLSMGFSRQEYWSGLLFPSLGDLPDPGIKPVYPALQADSLPTKLQGKPHWRKYKVLFLAWAPSTCQISFLSTATFPLQLQESLIPVGRQGATKFSLSRKTFLMPAGPQATVRRSCIVRHRWDLLLATPPGSHGKKPRKIVSSSGRRRGKVLI